MTTHMLCLNMFFFQTSIAENSFEYLCRNRISVPSLKQYYSSVILCHCQTQVPTL